MDSRGAIVGATNTWISGSTLFDDLAKGAVVGAISSVVGGLAGQYTATASNYLFSSISSPVLRYSAIGIVSGAAAGYASGFLHVL